MTCSLPTLQKLCRAGSCIRETREPGGNWDALPGSQSETWARGSRDLPRRSSRVGREIPPDSHRAGLKLRPRPPPRPPPRARAARRVRSVRAQAPRRAEFTWEQEHALLSRALPAAGHGLPSENGGRGVYSGERGALGPAPKARGLFVSGVSPRRRHGFEFSAAQGPPEDWRHVRQPAAGRPGARGLAPPPARALSPSPPSPRVLAVVDAADATPRAGWAGPPGLLSLESCGPGISGLGMGQGLSSGA